MGNLSSTLSRAFRAATLATIVLLINSTVTTGSKHAFGILVPDRTDTLISKLNGNSLLINEVDSDQTGTDTMEFIELYDGGSGNTPLDGLVVVLFNGSNDTSYAAFDLDGFSTDASGYFLLGNSAVPGVDRVFGNSLLQNGQDAVALFAANSSDFPNGTPVSTTALDDALVYDTGQADDAGLLVMLNAAQPQVDENQLGTGATVSMQRCPNGSGGQRNTNTYAVFAPTPGSTNSCGTPIVQLGAAAYSEDESQIMTITVVRTGNLTTASSVTLVTSDGNATGGSCEAGADYAAQNTTINFAPAENIRTLDIPICSDLAPDTAETFHLALSAPVNAAIGTLATAAGNITDTASQFKRSDPIQINDGALSSSELSITSGPTMLSTLRVTLFDVSADVADDLVVLLTSPAGQSIVLMADAGGAQIGPLVTLTFSDASMAFAPDMSTITSGTYKPTSWRADTTVIPGGPMPPYSEGGPGGDRPDILLNSVFAGQNTNGIWTLYVYDDDGLEPEARAPGVIAGGWAIETLGPSVAAVSVSGRIMTAAGLGIRGASIKLEGGGLDQPLLAASSSFGYYQFSGLVAGRTYLITVNGNRHVFAVPTRSITLHDSVSDADFIAEPIE